MKSKYRAWIKSREVMENVLGLEWNTHGDLTKVKTKSGTYNANQVNVMRCIGELDEQEVYEDDILYDPWEEGYATVKWSEEDFGYTLNWLNLGLVESMCSRNSDLDVAGNAYQRGLMEDEI